MKHEGCHMRFEDLIAQKIDEINKRCDDEIGRAFDAWDQAEIKYLEQIRSRLIAGEQPASVFKTLQQDLPELEKDVEKEASMPTFDQYDEHYYEKLCNGRLQACKWAINTYQTSPHFGEPPHD